MPQKILVYVGTYNRPAPYLGATNGKGIGAYSLDPDTGKLTFLNETEGIDNPSYLAIDPTGHFLYATSEVWGWKEGTCSAYAINRDTGELTYINKQPTLGGINAQLVVDKTNRCVLLTNYWEGKGVVLFPIRADGGVAPVSSSVEHFGTGPVAARQDRSHSHCVLPDPTNQYVFIADLGVDKLFSYKLDLDAGKLVERDAPPVQLTPGAGPRHFLFRPDGKFAYVIQELNSTITAMGYDADKGVLTPFQTVPALPEDYTEESHCAAIQITPDGKYLYGSNRAHNSIVIYAVDPASGRLTYVGHQSTGGKSPRDFNIDPTGTFLLAANQDSDTIVTFRIDPATGKLQDTGLVAQVPTPVCIKFVAV